MGKWLARNITNLLIAVVFIGVMVWFYRDKDLTEVWQGSIALLLMVVGLGLMIFIHELGHFLAAKWCGVRVHTFSVGFGPPIPGCHFTRGETFYKLAAFPIGGYVHMMGQEDPGVEAKEGDGPDDPRSFRNKTVGQRMLIISAGVIMNIILGLGCFVYVYLTGKVEIAPRFGTVLAGSPASLAGIEAGSEMLQIDDNEKPIFEDLMFTGAFARPGETEVYLKWKTPSGQLREAHVVPRKLEGDLKPMIGVGMPDGTVVNSFGKPGSLDPRRLLAHRNTPAAAADFRPGDKIIGVRRAGAEDFLPVGNGWDIAKAEYDLRGSPIEFQVRREDQTVVVPVAPRYFRVLGLHMEIGPIVAVQRGKYAPGAADFFKEGDMILAMDGDRAFDPMRLPDLVMDKVAAGQKMELTIQRGSEEKSISIEPSQVAHRGTWNEERPGPAVSIPGLGIAYEVRTTVRNVPEASPAYGKVRAGDIIRELVIPKTESASADKLPLKEVEWPFAFWKLQSLGDTPVHFKVQRAGSEQVEEVVLTTIADEHWPLPDRGLALEPESRTVYANDPLEAVALGFRDTYRTIIRIYRNLKALITGNVSVKTLSGPIDIVGITYGAASRGFNYLILFLGMLNINLAVVNFLPIPILDGGHMVFLMAEKLRGKPASDRVLIVANTIGLVVVGCLMVFVIALDISKKL